MDRDLNLKRIADRAGPWDVVVIGGGATGAGCALDAASRGFSVLLLEQHDFGKGTSSRSTKLIHGGVRYLRQGNISLVRESLRERALLLKNAPQAVRRQQFIIPCYSIREKYFYGFGMKVYDLLAGRHSIGRSQIRSGRAVIEENPGLEQANLQGGVLYFDAQFDDTRLLIDILRTADARGAVTLNYARVSAITKSERGMVDGVEFDDVETGDLFQLNARAVINAGGIFSSAVRSMSQAELKPAITYSQGVHLVFDRRFLSGHSAVLIPKTSDGRVLFCIPWKDHVLVGTTDTPVGTPKLEPHALEGEVDFILETAAKYLSTKPTRGDIKSVFAGIRPLIKQGPAVNTSSLSRGHELWIDSNGLVTIAGGKWTTFRKMAEDAVDKAIVVGGLKPAVCITEDLPIEPPKKSVDDTVLDEDFAFTRGDVVRAVNDEMARTVEDVLARRMRILFLDAQAAIDLAPKVAEIMAQELGHEGRWVDRQVEAFRVLADGYKPTLRRGNEY